MNLTTFNYISTYRHSSLDLFYKKVMLSKNILQERNVESKYFTRECCCGDVVSPHHNVLPTFSSFRTDNKLFD